MNIRLCRANLQRPEAGGLRFSVQLTLSAMLFAILATFAFSQAALATDPPVISPGTTGSYNSMQLTATISSDNAGSPSYYYTVNGTTPTPSSTLYSSAITVNNYTTIKAIAVVASVSSTVTTAYVQYEVPRSNLQLWLQPNNMVVSGSNITGWTDVSGYSTVVGQSTSTNQPTLVTGALNGFNAASFNGATSNSSYFNITSGSTGVGGAPFLSNLTGGVAIFAVINPVSSSAAKTLFTASHTGVTDMTALQTNGTTVIFNVNNGVTAENLTTASGAITTGTFQIVDAVLKQSNSANIDVNGITNDTGALQALNNTTRPVTYIGGNDALTTTAFWGGQVVEMLVYSTGTSFESLTAQVDAYLANKYQIGTTQITPAPTFSLATSTLTGPMQVAISAGPTAVTFFTQNGTTPTTSSTQYSAPLTVSYTQTIKAISVANGVQSSVATATYTLNSTQFPAPTTANTTDPLINLQLPTTAIPQ